MAELRIILNLILYGAATGLIAGLYNPVLVLWWCARQNRKMVLTYYGFTIALCLIIRFLLTY
jgi:hypothetical protein